MCGDRKPSFGAAFFLKQYLTTATVSDSYMALMNDDTATPAGCNHRYIKIKH
jgi:hypothetical protein